MTVVSSHWAERLCCSQLNHSAARLVTVQVKQVIYYHMSLGAEPRQKVPMEKYKMTENFFITFAKQCRILYVKSVRPFDKIQSHVVVFILQKKLSERCVLNIDHTNK